MSSLPREALHQSGVPTPTATIQAGENPLLNATPTPEPIDSSDQLNGEDAVPVSESNQEEAGQEESAVAQSKLEVSPVIKSYRVLIDTLPLLSPYDATTVMADVEFKEGDSIQSATSMIINGEEFIAVKVVLTPDDTAPQADDDKPVDDELTAESNEEPEVKYVWVPKRNLEEKEQVTITKTVREAVILAAALNVRSGPGTNHTVVGSLKAGDRVEIVGEEDGWYIVNLEGVGQAYISADPNLTKQESKDVSVTTGQEINSNLEKYASTNDEDEASTGMGGKIEPDQLLALAVEKFPGSAVSIYIDSEKGPIALDTNGNELGRFDNGKWKTMEEVSAKRYTAAEFLAAFPENEIVKEAITNLPKELLVENKTTGKAEKQIFSQDDFKLWMIGNKLFAQLQTGEKQIEMEWDNLDYRSGWIIKQFETLQTQICSYAGYNNIHPYRVRMIEEPIGLLEILPNSLKKMPLSQHQMRWDFNPTAELIKDYKELGYIGPNEDFQEYSDIDGAILVDRMMNNFFEILAQSPNVSVEGSIYTIQGKRKEIVIDRSKPVKFVIFRTPETENQIHPGEWYLGPNKVLDLPSNFAQVVESQLIFHVTLGKPGPYGIASSFISATSMFLREEAGIQPDKVNAEFYDYPVFTPLLDPMVELVKDKDGNRYTFNPLITKLVDSAGNVYIE